MSGMFCFLSDGQSGDSDELSQEAGINQTFLQDIKKYADLGMFPTVYVKTDLTQE